MYFILQCNHYFWHFFVCFERKIVILLANFEKQWQHQWLSSKDANRSGRWSGSAKFSRSWCCWISGWLVPAWQISTWQFAHRGGKQRVRILDAISNMPSSVFGWLVRLRNCRSLSWVWIVRREWGDVNQKPPIFRVSCLVSPRIAQDNPLRPGGRTEGIESPLWCFR